MALPWTDREQEDWEARVAHGQTNPDLTDRDTDHDDRLELADRQAEHAPAQLAGLAYTEQPSDRERAYWRGHADETRARNTLRPRTGNVQVQPRKLPCTCGAAARGLRLAGPAHRYGCPLHATRVDQETRAA